MVAPAEEEEWSAELEGLRRSVDLAVGWVGGPPRPWCSGLWLGSGRAEDSSPFRPLL